MQRVAFGSFKKTNGITLINATNIENIKFVKKTFQWVKVLVTLCWPTCSIKKEA